MADHKPSNISPTDDGKVEKKTDTESVGSSVDPEDTEKEVFCSKCENLIKLKVALAESLKEEAERQKKSAEDDLKDLRAYIKCLSKNYADLEERSNKITKQMADTMEKSGNLENINSDFSKVKLAKKFENLNNKEWIDACTCLSENMPEKSELYRISFLKKLMVKTYKLCEDMAENSIRNFLFLDEQDPLPTLSQIPELYEIRTINGQKESTRQRIKKTVSEKLRDGSNESHILEQTTEIVNFLKEFADCCWLMTISQPRLILQFDVVGKPYVGKLMERFTKYSSQERVKDKEMEKGTIKEVVWPCLELEDDTGFFKKGELIVVEEKEEDTFQDEK